MPATKFPQSQKLTPLQKELQKEMDRHKDKINKIREKHQKIRKDKRWFNNL